MSNCKYCLLYRCNTQLNSHCVVYEFYEWRLNSVISVNKHKIFLTLQTLGVKNLSRKFSIHWTFSTAILWYSASHFTAKVQSLNKFSLQLWKCKSVDFLEISGNKYTMENLHRRRPKHFTYLFYWVLLIADLQTTNTENLGTILLFLSSYRQFFISGQKLNLQFST